MIRKLLIILLVFFQTGNIISQETTLPITVIESPLFERDKRPAKFLYSKSDNKGGFIHVYIPFQGFKKNPPGYKIDHYNEKLELVKSYMLPYNDNEIRGLMMANGKIHIIESFKNKKEKSYDFNVLSSSLDEFNFEKKNLVSLDKTTFKEFFGISLTGFYMQMRSSNAVNESKIADVVFSEKDNFLSINLHPLYSKNVKLNSYVFNNDFQLIHKNEYVKELKKRNFEISELKVNDQDGTLHLLAKIKDKNNPKNKYSYELYKFTKDEKKQVILEAEGHQINSLVIVEDHQKIACVGFYAEEKNKPSVGVVRYSIDPVGYTTTSTSFNLFSKKFIVDKYSDDNKGELEHKLIFNSIFIDEKGDVIINAEEYYAIEASSYNSNSVRKTLHCEDIISCKISEQGELMWARNINRITESLTPSYSSILKDDKVYFVINGSDEFIKDSKETDEFSTFSSNASNIVFVISMNQEGELEYQKLVSETEGITYFGGRGTLNQEKSEVIMPGGKKGIKNFIKISF